ncbi:hypothetical protein PMX22_10025 [Clostridium butyricum]|jgi:hypothetical protein|uniref:hypothetical protein n=1 Tax=Clostridium butyricum TaxID=1492 RepID=UPI002057D954|nr:hypothetical protein [Clostridium butyricum]MDB2160138.1 hypothetical protein [Clostridium butyricum]DAQ97645.1 MAG TPA: hypothetical protein [Caudoviricetes sp.]
MDEKELIEAIEGHLSNNYACYDTEEEVLCIVNELIQTLTNEQARITFINNLKVAKEEYATDKNKCPNCR